MMDAEKMINKMEDVMHEIKLEKCDIDESHPLYTQAKKTIESQEEVEPVNEDLYKTNFVNPPNYAEVKKTIEMASETSEARSFLSKRTELIEDSRIYTFGDEFLELFCTNTKNEDGFRHLPFHNMFIDCHLNFNGVSVFGVQISKVFYNKEKNQQRFHNSHY